MAIENIVYFLLSSLVLVISGIFLVRSLTKISRFLGISEFSAAFIIMAFATSIPELFIGISSALSGNPSLSLGNVIGANILDLTLITGIIVLFAKKIKFKREKIGEELNIMLISIILLIFLFGIGKELSRIDGVILLGVFFIHVYRIFKKKKGQNKNKIKGGEKGSKSLWLAIFLMALVGLFISSSFVVSTASALALDFNFPSIVVGLFLLSFATTLPELVFGITASKLNHKSMAIGDQIGTVVANSTLILGVVAIIKPITAEFIPFIISGIFMFIAAFIFATFIKTGKKLESSEGISLILIYVLFIIIQLFIR